MDFELKGVFYFVEPWPELSDTDKVLESQCKVSNVLRAFCNWKIKIPKHKKSNAFSYVFFSVRLLGPNH